MNKLTSSQIRTKKEHETSLTVAADQIRQEIQAINSYISDASERIERLSEQYNSQVEAANAFMEEINSTQEAYIDGRSESWKEGDKGIMYRDWAGEWQLNLEPIEVDLPEEIEEPEFEGLDTLRDLPEQP